MSCHLEDILHMSVWQYKYTRFHQGQTLTFKDYMCCSCNGPRMSDLWERWIIQRVLWQYNNLCDSCCLIVGQFLFLVLLQGWLLFKWCNLLCKTYEYWPHLNCGIQVVGSRVLMNCKTGFFKGWRFWCVFYACEFMFNCSACVLFQQIW